MITYEELKRVNEGLKTIDQKGKAYVMVNERVKAFREIEPDGAITTDILSLADGVVVIKATITDQDGQVLATGIASEKEGSTFVNKTSYIENCETSAVGRALGFLGIGIDGSMASAEEVANAIIQQNSPTSPKMVSKSEKKTFTDLCTMYGVNPTEILKKAGWKEGEKMNTDHHGKAMLILKEIGEAQASE